MDTKSTTVRHSVVVRRPVKETWDLLTDFRTMPRWARGVEEVLEISPLPVGLGTKVTDIGLGLRRRWPETFWVDEFVPHQVLGLVWKGAYGTAHVRYTLEAVPDGTRLSGFTYGDYRFPFSLVLLFMARTARRNFEAGLADIKRLTEESGSSA